MEDIKILVNSIMHCDVMINHSSTISLEAFNLGKPVVNVAFDYDKKSIRNKLTKNGYSYSSYLPVVELNASRIANNMNELLDCVNFYLLNPNKDKKKRVEVLKLICGDFENSASYNLANELHNYIND